MKLGSTYEQKSVLFKDENQFALVYVDYGLMGLTFHSGLRTSWIRLHEYLHRYQEVKDA